MSLSSLPSQEVAITCSVANTEIVPLSARAAKKSLKCWFKEKVRGLRKCKGKMVVNRGETKRHLDWVMKIIISEGQTDIVASRCVARRRMCHHLRGTLTCKARQEKNQVETSDKEKAKNMYLKMYFKLILKLFSKL